MTKNNTISESVNDSTDEDTGSYRLEVQFDAQGGRDGDDKTFARGGRIPCNSRFSSGR